MAANTFVRSEQDVATLDQITPDQLGLRTDVDKESESYRELLASIKSHGIEDPLLVRPVPDSDDPAAKELRDNGIKYIIINGLHRWTACREVIEEFSQNPSEFQIPINIRVPQDQVEVMLMQISTNYHRVDTKPIQYRNHLQGIMSEYEARGEQITQAKLAELTNMSQARISQLLGLRKLTEDAEQAVENQKISAYNAYQLARLPEDEQEHFIERAAKQPADEFSDIVGNRLQEIKTRQRQEKKQQGFQPEAKVRKRNELLDLYEEFYHKAIATVPEEQLTARGQELGNLSVEDRPLDFRIGYFEALRYCLSLDDETVEAKEREYLQQQAERERKKQEKAVANEAESAAQNAVSNLRPKGLGTPIGF